MRKLFMAAFVAVAGIATAVTPAAAWWNWCEEDPLVTVTTPAHHQVAVYVTIKAGGDVTPAQLEQSVISYRVAPEGAGTDVRMTVSVPNPESRYVSKVVVSSQPNGAGTVYATSNDYSPAQTLHVEFHLPVS